MKYLILSIIILMPIIGLAETNAPAATVTEGSDSAKIPVPTAEQERDALLKEIIVLEKKIAGIEKENAQLKNRLLFVSQKTAGILKLSIKANMATSKILEALEQF